MVSSLSVQVQLTVFPGGLKFAGRVLCCVVAVDSPIIRFQPPDTIFANSNGEVREGKTAVSRNEVDDSKKMCLSSCCQIECTTRKLTEGCVICYTNFLQHRSH